MVFRFVHSLRSQCAILALTGLSILPFLPGCAASRSVRSIAARQPPSQPTADSAQSPNSNREELAAEVSSEPPAIQLAGGDSPPNDTGSTVGSHLPPHPRDAVNTAAPEATDGTTLSLVQLEALALQNNPTLAQAYAGVSVQQGEYLQAGLYPNPQVGYLNGSASNPAVKQSNGVFLSQEFVTARKLELDQHASAQEIKRLEWDREAQCMRVLNDLRIRYYELLGAQEGVEVARNIVRIAEESLRVTERLLEAKQGTRTDMLQARVQLETLKLNLEEAEFRHAAAWEQLATIIGVPAVQRAPLQGSLTDGIPDLEFDVCWQELQSRSPQLRAAESELDHGWAMYSLSRAQVVPNVTIQSVVEYDRATQATTASTLVALPLPVFNRNQGNIDKALADIQVDQTEISRVQLVLRDQLADSFRRYQTSRRQTERLRQTIVPSAEESLKLAMQLHSAGETSFGPVLLSQQTLFESQVAYVEAMTELHKVVIEIQGLQLTGGLNPAAIGSAIQNQPGTAGQRQRALLKEVQDKASKQLLPAAQIGQ